MVGEAGHPARRGLLCSLSAGVLAGCSGVSPVDFGPPLAPIRARPDRIIDIAVCLRPFRPAGPRVETERLGDTLVVHNYGHGGSGWSLSWGSSARAVRPGDAGQSARGGGDRLRGAGAHLGDPGATGRCPRHHLRPRSAAGDDVGARHRRVDARFAHGPCRCRCRPTSATVWEEMARTAFKDASRLSRPAGHAGRMDRPVRGFRRTWRPSAQAGDTDRTIPPTIDVRKLQPAGSPI